METALQKLNSACHFCICENLTWKWVHLWASKGPKVGQGPLYPQGVPTEQTPSTLHQRLQVISAFHLARMETCIQVSKTLPSSVPSFIQFWRCLEHEICLSSDHSTSIVFAPFFTSESIFVAYHTRDIPCSICMAWCFSACNRMVNKHDSAPNIKTGQMKKQTQNAFPTFLRRFLTSSPVTTWETRIQFLGEALVFLFSLAYALGLQQPWQVLPS